MEKYGNLNLAWHINWSTFKETWGGGDRNTCPPSHCSRAISEGCAFYPPASRSPAHLADLSPPHPPTCRVYHTCGCLLVGSQRLWASMRRFGGQGAFTGTKAELRLQTNPRAHGSVLFTRLGTLKNPKFLISRLRCTYTVLCMQVCIRVYIPLVSPFSSFLP